MLIADGLAQMQLERLVAITPFDSTLPAEPGQRKKMNEPDAVRTHAPGDRHHHTASNGY